MSAGGAAGGGGGGGGGEEEAQTPMACCAFLPRWRSEEATLSLFLTFPPPAPAFQIFFTLLPLLLPEEAEDAEANACPLTATPPSAFPVPPFFPVFTFRYRVVDLTPSRMADGSRTQMKPLAESSDFSTLVKAC